MKFTDEDLKRLKEMKEKYNYFNFPTAWDLNEAYDLIEALLHRLEVAEKALDKIERKATVNRDPHDNIQGIVGRLQNIAGVVREWHRAKGGGRE